MKLGKYNAPMDVRLNFKNAIHWLYAKENENQ